MEKGTIIILLFIIGGIPLLAYPFVLVGNVMTVAAQWSGNEKKYLRAIVYSFMFATTSYLLTYIICLVCYFIRGDQSILLSAIPLIHLSIILFIAFLWKTLG